MVLDMSQPTRHPSFTTAGWVFHDVSSALFSIGVMGVS